MNVSVDFLREWTTLEITRLVVSFGLACAFLYLADEDRLWWAAACAGLAVVTFP